MKFLRRNELSLRNPDRKTGVAGRRGYVNTTWSLAIEERNVVLDVVPDGLRQHQDFDGITYVDGRAGNEQRR